MPTAIDIVLFTTIVYGVAWVVSKSKLTKRARWVIQDVWFVGDLANCIVCTATWVGMWLAVLLPHVALFSLDFRVVHAPIDVLALGAWSTATSWFIGQLTGDAE